MTHPFPHWPRAYRTFTRIGVIGGTFGAGFFLGQFSVSGGPTAQSVFAFVCAALFFIIVGTSMLFVGRARKRDNAHMHSAMRHAAEEHEARHGRLSRDPYQ